jgi:hypothetical protein
MAQIVKLMDEKTILKDLKQDTMGLIRSCYKVEPVKKFVECYDILDLTLQIQEMYPTQFPKIPECDPSALLHLRTLTQELLVFYWIDLPHPDFGKYTIKVQSLLRLFRLPKEEFEALK